MMKSTMAQLHNVMIILLLFYSLNQVASEEYYITANSTDLCIPPCLTLTQLATNFSLDLFNSNSTLIFSPGIHYLNVNLTVSNLSTFWMTSGNRTAQIRCARYVRMIFNWSQNILITNLEFIGCGNNQVTNVEKLIIRETTFSVLENSRSVLQLTETTGQIINCAFSSIYWSRMYGRVIIATHSKINISQSNFENNGARSFDLLAAYYVYGQVILAQQQSIININASTFTHNCVRHGVLYSHSSSITTETSKFHNNIINVAGLLTSLYGNTTIEQCVFEQNIGGSNILFFLGSSIIIKTSEFYHNFMAIGAVLHLRSSSATSEKNKFNYNTGIIFGFNDSNITVDMNEFKQNKGSVVLSTDGKVIISASTFDNNTVVATIVFYQGMILGCNSGTFIINNCNFTNNNAPVIVALSSRIEHYNSLLIMNNSAVNEYAIIQLYNSEFIGHRSGNAMISNNMRSLVAFTSNVTFMGNVKFLNNQRLQNVRGLQEGGAITLVQSNAFFDGKCNIEHNHAENGGAIFSIESSLYVTGNVTVAHNTANRNGGGIYLTESNLECLNKSILILFNNTANHKGGGLHAISSFVKAISVLQATKVETAMLNFTNNVAERGGGLSLEANAKLVVLKYEYGDIVFGSNFLYEQVYSIHFSANTANTGGAIYVDDDTNSGTCTSDPKTECFFQVLAYIHGLYGLLGLPEPILNYTRANLKPQSLYFSENNASISGSTLYGGLLDRCAVNQFAEVRIKYAEQYKEGGNGIVYLEHVSTTFADESISSQPVKVCLCIDNELNCTHQGHIAVKKGEAFTVSLASMDQINHPVNGLIHTSLKYAGSAVASGQATREIPAKCTNLTFNVFSPHSSEQLTLYALDGPCKDTTLSTISLDIYFLPCSCPVGLQTLGTNETSCTCECHEKINQYVEECDSRTGVFHRKSPSNAWIAFTNNTKYSDYLVYPNCPFDYCNSLNLSIDLNQPNGADAQCAFNRSSLLCGSCQPGLSLSLGSSRCLSCPNYWLAVLTAISITAILAGIVVVTLLLVLNMTVAVGTLNGLIFYANVVYANKSILLPFQETSFITVFISWLNMELGIDTCYFPEMDTFGKTWLQLAFPAYVILLVALVIIISSYSSRFSNLIGKKDPVATLATLILLSYAKLLEVCFKSLSFGNLKYPDGSVKILWLPDATILYLSGKHTVLFLAAVLVLLVGLVYTALLFSWQWLLHLPQWRIFRWTRDQRIQTFIETYSIPYVPKHRYWTGFLLLARAILYLVAAVNVSNDPTVALNAIIVVICCILALKAFIGSRLYRKWPVDVLETFFYLNILLFTTFTWYCLGECRNKKAAAYISVLTMFIVLLLIILYHVYTYTSVFSKVKGTKPVNKLKELITPAAKDRKQEVTLPPDDVHGLHDLLNIIDCPVNTNDYTVPVKQAEPTRSIVEVHQPQLEPPDPKESNSQIEVIFNKDVS